ncbi:hypothetical protein Acsp04_17560 [Actinomadura sp. NBRC 104425]|uniref:hypothetical protein n=1 Tax=Actinomadura sp. NBRC 104425 TaxID=3032204 RepID=UPI0024A5F953|nr:hypothetical protein [Actinomadura sp. NBRC 104425]GLZ11521.1 hypothetical protein Acsp04_17560 [Actinomadura sp. NBRC 104425]
MPLPGADLPQRDGPRSGGRHDDAADDEADDKADDEVFAVGVEDMRGGQRALVGAITGNVPAGDARLTARDLRRRCYRWSSQRCGSASSAARSQPPRSAAAA